MFSVSGLNLAKTEVNYMIDDRKTLAIQHLAEGEKNKSEIAKIVNISRTTLYSWLEDEEFKAELDKRLQQRKNLVEKIIDSKLEDAVESLVDLSKKSDNDMVRMRALTYLLDRGLGKATTKVEVETAINNNLNVNDDLLELEYDDPDIIEHATEE